MPKTRKNIKRLIQAESLLGRVDIKEKRLFTSAGFLVGAKGIESVARPREELLSAEIGGKERARRG